jgi:hypothetical protein
MEVRRAEVEDGPAVTALVGDRNGAMAHCFGTCDLPWHVENSILSITAVRQAPVRPAAQRSSRHPRM